MIMEKPEKNGQLPSWLAVGEQQTLADERMRQEIDNLVYARVPAHILTNYNQAVARVQQAQKNLADTKARLNAEELPRTPATNVQKLEFFATANMRAATREEILLCEQVLAREMSEYQTARQNLIQAAETARFDAHVESVKTWVENRDNPANAAKIQQLQAELAQLHHENAKELDRLGFIRQKLEFWRPRI